MMALAVQTMAPAVAAERVHQTPARVRERPAALPALTGVRFLAALMVVAYHLRDGWGLLPLPAAWSAVQALLDAVGYEAVSFFFLLSGFILTYSYVDPVGRLRASARAYYAGRLARLMPAYLLGCALGVVPFLCWVPAYAPWTAGRKVLALLSTLTLSQGWFPQVDASLNTPSWSLSAEALFYLLFPLLALAPARLPRRWLAPVALTLWAAMLAGPLLYLLAVHGHLIGMGDRVWAVATIAHPLVRLPEFGLGATLGWLHVRGVRLSRPGVIALLCALALPAAILLTGRLPLVVREDGLLAPLWAVLIYALAHDRGLAARALATPLLVLLGEASYALYILHWPLHDWLARALPAPAAGRAGAALVWAGGYTVLCVAASVLALCVVEHPGRRALMRVLAPRRPAVVSARWPR